MQTQALVHVAGLGAQPCAGDGRIGARIILPWLREYWTDGFMSEGIVQRCAKILREADAAPPVMTAFVTHPHLRPLALAQAGRDMAEVDKMQQFARLYRGPADRLLPLEYHRALVERMVGKCATVENARRVARACLLRLHPDKVPLPADPAARKGQLSLFRNYCAVLELLEDPVVGPHTVGTPVHTGPQAARALFLVACQRVGYPAALIGVSVGAVGLVGGAAWALTVTGGWHHLFAGIAGILLGFAIATLQRHKRAAQSSAL